ncbi:MAG: hypothetical protein Q8920_15495 [Bacillota bacterium]|nr:hypothetical protein [Bacillota bacterium]
MDKNKNTTSKDKTKTKTGPEFYNDNLGENTSGTSNKCGPDRNTGKK